MVLKCSSTIVTGSRKVVVLPRKTLGTIADDPK